MRFSLSLLCIFLLLNVNATFSQTITYSEFNREDNKNINFEILGNFNGNTIIYKNIQRRHLLSIYDPSMAIRENIKLDFISDKTFNVDFITYPDKFFLIYQYERNNIVYCKGAVLGSDGKLIGEVLDLDTTRIGAFADNRIYYVANSEDKQNILLYKMQKKNNDLLLSTKLYDASFRLLDSTRSTFDYSERNETYGDLQVGNDGVMVFTKETRARRSDYTSKLELFYKKGKDSLLMSRSLPLDEKFIEDVSLKIDNLNRNYVVNSFSYGKRLGNIEGLFTMVISKDDLYQVKKAYNIFDDSIRSKLSDNRRSRSAFDNFFLRNVILKKDGGFLIMMEEEYEQNRGFNRGFNRGYYSDPFYYSPNYYRFQRNYYDYYWWNSTRNSQRDVLYNYNDVVIHSFTKDLQPQWGNVINKTQSSVDTDNFLSFSTMNMGSEIHFFFLQKDINRQIISDFALQPNGAIKRYPTIKSREAGFSFMPRLAKQVSARQVIIPCIFRNSIAFARIDYSNTF
jgi:hypothetical protein